LAALLRAARFRPGLAAAGVAAFQASHSSARPISAPLWRRDDPPAPPGLRRRFFRAAIAGAGDAGAATFRPAAQRFLCAAARRRRAATLTMRLDASEAVAGAGDEPSSRWSFCW
jgi:hypothetical protein